MDIRDSVNRSKVQDLVLMATTLSNHLLFLSEIVAIVVVVTPAVLKLLVQKPLLFSDLILVVLHPLLLLLLLRLALPLLFLRSPVRCLEGRVHLINPLVQQWAPLLLVLGHKVS